MTLRERWNGLAKRERYLLLAFTGLAGVALVRFFGSGVLGDVSLGGDDTTWVQTQKIESYRKIAARAESAAKQGKELEKRYAQAQARLLAGSTPTEVGAELQGRLSSMASAAGLNVLSSQILREEEDGEFRQVGVRLSLSGGLEGVARLLSSVETGEIDLKVTLLEINRKLGASRRPVPGRNQPPPAAVSPLTATMEIKTYMQEPL